MAFSQRKWDRFFDFKVEVILVALSVCSVGVATFDDESLELWLGKTSVVHCSSWYSGTCEYA